MRNNTYNKELEKQKSNDKRQPKIAENSIDYIYHVNRLPIYESGVKGIYIYGRDNNYPYKVKQLAVRSNSLVTAINTNTKFLIGEGFEGATKQDVLNNNSVIVNEKMQLNAYQLLCMMANEKSQINTAVHVNYNQLGEAVEFTPIQYEFVRRKIKEEKDNFDKYIISNIWHLENQMQNDMFFGGFTVQNINKWIHEKKLNKSFNALEVYAYNPDPIVVREQIAECGGIENYSGQIFYSKNTTEIYQKAYYDSVLDDAQIEAEAKLYSISNLQNSFSASGIMLYPMNIDSVMEKQKFTDKARNATGAVNAGRLITMPYNPSMNVPTNLFQPITLQNIDSLFEKQKEEAKKNIYELYQQTGIVNGRSDSGMFNQQSMQDAFTFQNSVTKVQRFELEMELTTLFSNSVFKNDVKLPIEIKELVYFAEQKDTSQNDSIRAESQARLKGTVGGVQGILQIQTSVSQGLTQHDAGIEILKDIYGYEDYKARAVLGEPIQQFSENQETVDEEEANNVEPENNENND